MIYSDSFLSKVTGLIELFMNSISRQKNQFAILHIEVGLVTVDDPGRRSKTGGTLLRAESGAGAAASWFTVGVFKEQVTVEWRLAPAGPALRRMRARDHLQWTTLRFRLAGDQITGKCWHTHSHM